MDEKRQQRGFFSWWSALNGRDKATERVPLSVICPEWTRKGQREDSLLDDLPWMDETRPQRGSLAKLYAPPLMETRSLSGHYVVLCWLWNARQFQLDSSIKMNVICFVRLKLTFLVNNEHALKLIFKTVGNSPFFRSESMLQVCERDTATTLRAQFRAEQPIICDVLTGWSCSSE